MSGARDRARMTPRTDDVRQAVDTLTGVQPGVLVVKVGGPAGLDLERVCADVAELHRLGRQVVLVHGGNAELDRLSTQLGHPPRFVTSPSGIVSRYTDRATLEIFQMVYRGKLNSAFVEHLQASGANAVGLSGLDGRLVEGKRKRTVRSVEDGKTIVLHDNFTGTVERVNGAMLLGLLAAGYLPVVCPPAISEEGEAINVDGDRMAAAIATELRADELLLLSDVPGLLSAYPDPDSLITAISPAGADAAMDKAAGRMKRKVMEALAACQAGVKLVVIGDARLPRPVRSALAGAGTRVSL